jgi:hypothetical protein
MPDDTIIAIDSKASAARLEGAKEIPVFSIDGTTYSIPAVERADLGLEYLALVDEESEDVANAWLMKQTIGEDGFQALRAVKGLSPDDFRGVMDKIQKIVAPKARSSRRQG